jgi:hypothetical protein
MSARRGALAAIAFFAAYTLALTWPGVLPFNRVHPLVLGMPFNMFWVALWVALGGIALWAIDRALDHGEP